MPEIRFEATDEEVAVLDGYCSSTGKHRTDVMKDLLAMWSRAKLHEATVILRVAGRHPTSAEVQRKTKTISDAA